MFFAKIFFRKNILYQMNIFKNPSFFFEILKIEKMKNRKKSKFFDFFGFFDFFDFSFFRFQNFKNQKNIEGFLKMFISKNIFKKYFSQNIFSKNIFRKNILVDRTFFIFNIFSIGLKFWKAYQL